MRASVCCGYVHCETVFRPCSAGSAAGGERTSANRNFYRDIISTDIDVAPLQAITTPIQRGRLVGLLDSFHASRVRGPAPPGGCPGVGFRVGVNPEFGVSEVEIGAISTNSKFKTMSFFKSNQ